MNEQEILKRLEALEQENAKLRADIEKIPKYPNFKKFCNGLQCWMFDHFSVELEKWLCLEFAPILQRYIETNVDAKTEFKKLVEKDEQEDESRRLNN